MSCLIAIDQSTSATKALLVGDDGVVVDSESRQHTQHYPRAGWVEHDAAEIWDNMLGAAETLARRNTVRLSEVVGVSLSNQRETFVVFDRSTGEPLAPAVVWQCRRGDAICQQLRDSGAEPLVQERTGLRIDSYFSGAKIAWVMRECPEIAARVRDGSACVATIDAYLIHRLTRGDCYATDQTNASRTLLMDVRRLRWDEELGELFDLPLGALPEIRDSTAEFGETDLGGVLPVAVPICGVLGDSQASLFAQRCYDTGDVKATFGSGTSVMLNVGPEFLPPGEGAVGALAWVVEGKPTYAWEGLINYSAATVAWLKDQLGLIDSIDEVERLAGSVDDADGVFLVPAFSGLGAPFWRPQARAAIVGMTGRTSKAHVVRAALDSIALQISDVTRMLSASGVSPKTLYADGGPTGNVLLMQLVADATRCEILATAEPNLSPLGAAMAGLLGLGLVGSLDELRALPSEARQYTPQNSEADASKHHSAWREAVERVL